LSQLRAAIAERLRLRRQEIDEAVIHRALSVAPPTGGEAPGYVEALRAAIPAAVDYALDAIELGEDRLGPTPAAISEQAAASARSGVGLEVSLRRYAAGYSTISDFLHQELRVVARGSDPSYATLQRELTALFDRLVAEVSEAHRREEARASRSPHELERERVRRLMVGELVDPAKIDYPFDGFHLAIVVTGDEPDLVPSVLAQRVGRRLLVAETSSARCAAWLGGIRSFGPEELETLTSVAFAGHIISFGEPAVGLAGWRRSRRQAEAAQLIAGRRPGPSVRYRDVALEAAALRDPDLHHYLTETYVDALGDGRSQLTRTLLTFLERGRNASATAAALGISRQTVAGHIDVVEEKLGRPLEEVAAQLETALRLDHKEDQ
jgi:DNA-binding PucR family transcriptional regulator